MLMSNSKHVKTGRSVLKKILAATFLVGLLGIVFCDAGICQTSGYGEKPDEWAPYKSGQYFEQLQEIVKTYSFDPTKITYLHFEQTGVGIGPVELFRFPTAGGQDCSENDCYFFALVASDHSGTPLLTSCQFKLAALSHLFNPDGSRFFGFEFSCDDSLLRVKVTPTHFMAISAKKMPENGT
jgi:hypothetical protein